VPRRAGCPVQTSTRQLSALSELQFKKELFTTPKCCKWEFERTAKRAACYYEISKSIVYDDSTDLVLYLAANQELLSLLAQELRTLEHKDQIPVCSSNERACRPPHMPFLDRRSSCHGFLREYSPWNSLVQVPPLSADFSHVCVTLSAFTRTTRILLRTVAPLELRLGP